MFSSMREFYQFIVNVRSHLNYSLIEDIWNKIKYLFNIIFYGSWRNEVDLLSWMCTLARQIGVKHIGLY